MFILQLDFYGSRKIRPSRRFGCAERGNLNAPRVGRQPLELSDRPDGRCRDEDFSPPTGSPEAAPPTPTERWRADFQRHALRQLVHSFHCYLFKFRFHGQPIFSLAVTPVAWSPCRPRTIQLPLTASPFGWLSRPRSTISQYGFQPIISPFSSAWQVLRACA